MKHQKSNQKGFTLIELIIVIVILGILAVTAAPRFIDLQSDARASTLEGVKAALQGSSQLVYAKAAIQGVQSSSTAVDVTLNGSDTVSTILGYPNALTITSNANVTTFLDLSAGDFEVHGNGTDDDFVITFESTAVTDKATAIATNCYIQYTNASSSSPAPSIVVEPSGC
ncbi:prepilin-type N-terminal cleavage/methylation domain-containing protein [Glaciecola sp. MH2013]|uniref:prepilin-type N-terminal cleavage/methylation domain-containing protein n=1 Tax=Glaciecola sp. MH2013 TaxID=2785524 RepID=UPI00189ED9D7|nr:prepilin-type N-terminal cleavage/methylation domain-containing protein [Glaciecola sp. MH2013]MBF7073697.1 prepilin-type N-terminal cleavage/methylation domain-containing protein [Glaciecola sp. MH2013]